MSSKYGIVLVLHIVFIFVDLAFNTAATILFNDNNAQLLLFILQDTTIVMSVIVLLITFSSTFVFQAGLISLLLRRFAPTLVVASCYLALSIGLHVFSLRDRWGTKERYVWPTWIIVLYVTQRTVAFFHYFFLKRAALLLSDPRYHYDSEWLREQIRLKQ